MRFLDLDVSVDEQSANGELSEALMQADMTRAINRGGGEVDWSKRRPVAIGVDGVTHLFDYDRSVENRTNTELVILRCDNKYVTFVESVVGWKLIPIILEVKMPNGDEAEDEAMDWFSGIRGAFALLEMFKDRL